MNFVVVQTFNDYMSAEMLRGRLEEAGIQSWLKDEYTVTIYPMLSNAVGGIKLVVADADKQEALQVVARLNEDSKSMVVCPQCGSHEVEYVSSNRKPLNWFMAIITYFIASYAIAPDKVYHCFNCGKEFEEQ